MEKAVKKPKSKGVAKVPVIIQLENLECGAASLAMILAYYDTWVPLEKARLECAVSRDGSSAINIIKAARNYNLTARGYRFDLESIQKEATFPCIIHWNFNHFVVLKGFKGNRAYINDPEKGAIVLPMEVFDRSYTGVCLIMEPNEDYVPQGKKKSIFKFIGKRTEGLRTPVIITIFTTAIAALLGVMSPMFNRIFYDRLLGDMNEAWLAPFLIGLGMLYLIQIAVSVINTVASMRVNGKMDITGNLTYMWKVLHLPMHFFSQRYAGDISARSNSNAAIANTIVKISAPLLINTVMMIFYFFIMIKYSVILTIVGIISSLINMFVSQYISKKRIDLIRVQVRDSGKLSAMTVSGVQMIDTIKSSGAEEGYFERWAGCYASVNEAKQKYTKQDALLGLIPSIVSSLGSALILGIGVFLTITADFSLGSITAFQGFFALFIAPVTQFINSGQQIREMRTQMERIDDVMEYPDDPNVVSIEPEEGEKLRKLSGAVEIKNISFGYSPLSEPLIKDFNMSIKPGSSVAFVGPSGCGKSTLSKLISGLYSPATGEILFDGKHVNEIDHGIFTSSLAVVDQDIIIFDDTIANNIKMLDNSIEDFEMILAAKDANLHYDIVQRPGGYQYKLTEGGKDLSGGQRQRLEIARVLAQEPNIIIMDEATSALDARTEHEIVKAIKDRGITCIVVAHRLSTIRDCDEIIVLDKGNVVERGTHDELIRNNGYYYSLITNE